MRGTIMTGEKYPVLILAGGPTPEKILAEGEKEKERAFIDIGGRPMLQFVLDAVDKSGIASELLVMGNSKRMVSTFGLKPEQVSDDRNSMLENFMYGLERFKDHPLVVSTTCDAPLLTGESLRFIADAVSKMDAEVYYTIVDVKEFDKEMPGGKRTTQKLKEGTYTGGNVFVLNPKKVLENREKIEAVIRDRKSPAKLIRLFGLPFIVKFALKQLDMKGLEDKATQILGAKMRAVVTPYAGVGFDVDKPIDLVMARQKIGHA
jgi:molybdopterin-guanine dinucleotide biosynthesis protein A